MIELLITLIIIGLVAGIGVFAWTKTRGRAELTAAARTAKTYLLRARMTAIFEGVNYFLVYDPSRHTLEIYADTGTIPASFDDQDSRVASAPLHAAAGLTLPTNPPNLNSPLDSSSLSNAWSLPTPDSAARWGNELFGLMITPTGLVQSAESTPATINAGVMVFSNGTDITTAVGIRGREGSIRTYEYYNGKWKEL